MGRYEISYWAEMFTPLNQKGIYLERSLFLWGNLRINLQIETNRKIELLIYKWTHVINQAS